MKIPVELFEGDYYLLHRLIANQINKLEDKEMQDTYEYKHLKGLENRLNEVTKEFDDLSM